MGRIEDHRIAETAHDGKRTHVDDQIVVAEGRSTLRHDNPVVAGILHLLDGIPHFRRRQELAFLDVHDFAGLCGSDQQVGLPTKKGGNLEHVHHLPGLGRLILCVHVGQNRDTDLLLDLGQDGKPLL